MVIEWKDISREEFSNHIGDSPCKNCGKTFRLDYHGYCADCWDELTEEERAKCLPQ